MSECKQVEPCDGRERSETHANSSRTPTLDDFERMAMSVNTTAADPEQVRQVETAVKGMLARAKAIVAAWEIRFGEWLENQQHTSTKSGFSIGDKVVWYGPVKEVKPKMPAADAARLIVTTLSLDDMLACLSSGCIKQGTARKMLDDVGRGDLWEQMFERVEKLDIQGKPIKGVQAVDPTFVQGGG